MPAHAATITVTNTNDSGPGSLRQALAIANNGDRINFAVTGTISLTSGGLGIGKNVTISGPGANQLAINGSQGWGPQSVFRVFPQKTVTISGNHAVGGILNNQATVSVSNCALTFNSIGIFNHVAFHTGVIATATISNSLIRRQ